MPAPSPVRLAAATIVAVLALAPVSVARQKLLGPGDVNALPSKPADARITYGPAPEQFGDLRLPSGTGPFPLAIVIHGGCFVSRIATLQNSAAMADALRDAGLATWNIEYRRIGDQGGGWPGTFQDVGLAADYVRTLMDRYPIDRNRVISVGHSAGAFLAMWLAARERVPVDSPRCLCAIPSASERPWPSAAMATCCRVRRNRKRGAGTRSQTSSSKSRGTRHVWHRRILSTCCPSRRRNWQSAAALIRSSPAIRNQHMARVTKSGGADRGTHHRRCGPLRGGGADIQGVAVGPRGDSARGGDWRQMTANPQPSLA